MSETIKSRMRNLLEQLNYDFSKFTFGDFVAWLEEKRGRKIEFREQALRSPDLYGAWLAGEDRDFIFYEQNTLPIHQTHICLHELSHMICNHSTGKIAALNGSQIEAVLLRSLHSNEEEEEAEIMASTAGRKSFGSCAQYLTGGVQAV